MDELLRRLARSYGISMFGADPELLEWDEEADRAEFRE
ncbi:MAG: hypothetical protein MAG715_00532 [Methanonatronarchaeales archaeon]|nr:hypothetical protein [Methanonatronarchaeales archaeon]